MFVEAIVVLGDYKANAFTANWTYIHRDVQSNQPCTSTTNTSMTKKPYVYPDVIVKHPSTSPKMFDLISSNQLQPMFYYQELDHSSARSQVLHIPGR